MNNYVHKNIYWDLYNRTKDDCKYYKDLIDRLEKKSQVRVPVDPPIVKRIIPTQPYTCVARGPAPPPLKNDLSPKKEIIERCTYIKKNKKQCRQCGKPTQSGGPIINGRCKYHR